MAKKRYEADYVLNLNKTISSLQSAKKQAEAFDDIMSNIGDRGNFNDLIKYFLSLDNAVDELRQSTNELMSGLGDSLKGGYIKSLDGVFNKLAEISRKSHELFDGISGLDLKDPNASKQLEQYATRLNEVFKSLNVKNRINLKVFNTKSVEEQFERLVKAAKILNTEINTSLGNINVGDIKAEIEDAFSGAGMAITDFSEEVQQAVKKLEDQNKKLSSVQKELKKTAKMIEDVKSKGNSAIPDDFALDDKDIKVDKIVKLLDEYDELDAQIKAGKQSTEDYADSLMRLSEITMTLKKAFSSIRADSSLNDLFSNLSGGGRGGSLLGALSAYANTKSTGLFNKIIKANKEDVLGGLITANTSKIERIKADAMKNLGDGLGSGAQKAASSLSAVEEKLKEIDKLIQELEDYSFDDPEFEKLENQIESLKKSFIELYQIQDENLIGQLEDLGIDEETTKEIIANFKKIITAAQEASAAIGGAGGTGDGNRIINADQLKNDLKQIHDLALKTGKELSFSVDAMV